MTVSEGDNLDVKKYYSYETVPIDDGNFLYMFNKLLISRDCPSNNTVGSMTSPSNEGLTINFSGPVMQFMNDFFHHHLYVNCSASGVKSDYLLSTS